MRWALRSPCAPGSGTAGEPGRLTGPLARRGSGAGPAWVLWHAEALHKWALCQHLAIGSRPDGSPRADHWRLCPRKYAKGQDGLGSAPAGQLC